MLERAHIADGRNLMSEKETKWYHVELNEAEIGLLISVLLADIVANGNFHYECIVPSVKTTSDLVFK
jgi:hypothetical protein